MTENDLEKRVEKLEELISLKPLQKEKSMIDHFKQELMKHLSELKANKRGWKERMVDAINGLRIETMIAISELKVEIEKLAKK